MSHFTHSIAAHPAHSYHIRLLRIRQKLREKHARHVADLKAYYESEIQLLHDKLELGELPRDVEKANQTLTKRCVLFTSVQSSVGPWVFLHVCDSVFQM